MVTAGHISVFNFQSPAGLDEEWMLTVPMELFSSCLWYHFVNVQTHMYTHRQRENESPNIAMPNSNKQVDTHRFL